MPKQIDALHKQPRTAAIFSGKVSFIDLQYIMLPKLPATPINNLLIVRLSTVPNMLIAELAIAMNYVSMAAFRRPILMSLPPITFPAARPIIPAELIIVLYRIVSSFVQLNLASKTIAVCTLPLRAQEQCHVPIPQAI